MSTIDETLEDRFKKYGDYEDTSRIAQNIKRAISDSPNWDSLSDDKRESLDMIANKLARILNGDSEYADSWHDIIGYAKLVEERLNICLEGEVNKNIQW